MFSNGLWSRRLSVLFLRTLGLDVESLEDHEDAEYARSLRLRVSVLVGRVCRSCVCAGEMGGRGMTQGPNAPPGGIIGMVGNVGVGGGDSLDLLLGRQQSGRRDELATEP